MVLGIFYSSFAFIYQENTIENINFLIKNYENEGKILRWVQTLPFTLKLEQEIELGHFPNLNLSQIKNLREKTKNHFSNIMTKYEVADMTMNLYARNDAIAELYLQIYEGNLCDKL